MASLFKKAIKSTDPKTGRTVKRKSAKWWGKYRDPVTGKIERVPLAADKQAAQAMLGERIRKAERLAAGQADPFDDHARKPLAKHVSEFRAYLAAKGNTELHVATTAQRVSDVVTGCKWKFAGDISASRVQSFLADLRTGGRALATSDQELSKRPASIATANHYLRACKMFTRWLVKDRRCPDDRLAHLEYASTETDRRRVRRSLTADELAKLIRAAEAGQDWCGLSGPERAALYLLAAYTGLRRSELGSLTAESFDFDGDPPTVAIEAGYAKNRRRDVLPLRADLAERLQGWLATKAASGAQGPLFALGRLRTAEMLQSDLEAAGVSVADDSGRVVDFHALRGTFISNLARSGVTLTVAQKLARHSDPKLTANVYTVLGVHDHAAAVESLPPIPSGDTPQGRGGYVASHRHRRSTGRIRGALCGAQRCPKRCPTHCLGD